VSVSFTEKIRPYVGVSFHQRSFQGIQTSATGFALSLGTEYTLSPGMSLVLNLRYMSLKASSLIQGTETAFQSGLSFGF
jgi:opacity protein-like surface antigen